MNPNPELHLENLVVPTSEQARKNGRLGGLKRAENQRKLKRTKELIDIIGNLPIKDKKALKILKKNFSLSEEEKEICFDAGVIMRIYDKAFKEGHVPSAVFIRDSRGEAPVVKKAQTDSEGKDIPIIHDDVK